MPDAPEGKGSRGPSATAILVGRARGKAVHAGLREDARKGPQRPGIFRKRRDQARQGPGLFPVDGYLDVLYAAVSGKRDSA
ncbi:MAG: hypothetical protein HY579_06825 [Nitrospinae bacterium]|nr:hypothetical protein [Nitrospinota bacterium]